jgi:hypothetical protein
LWALKVTEAGERGLRFWLKGACKESGIAILRGGQPREWGSLGTR